VNTATIWRVARERLHHKPFDPVCLTWLQDAYLSSTPSLEDDIENAFNAQEQRKHFTLYVPSERARDVLQTRWHHTLEDALMEAAGEPISLTIMYLPGEENSQRDQAVHTEHESKHHAIASSSYEQDHHAQYEHSLGGVGTGLSPTLMQPTLSYMGDSLEEWDNEQRANILAHNRLNPRYTFDAFIVGNSNRLAHAASLAVAEAPGESYNPLFLYGGVGLGKTHLLHAIGHQGVQTGLAVLYVSSEQFTNEIINAIRYRTTEEFRAKYRSVDILLVDDIQFIAGKESTEEEFFHTFNSLYEMSKQIVICSDRPPKAIVSLEERLRSRFEWGLIADIQPPDLETRMAILRVKADLLHYRVPDEIIAYIASRVQTNIRELEGCLNRLMAYQQLHRVDLTLDVARAAMSSLGNDTRETHLTSRQIAQIVADYYRISLEAMCSKQRDKHIVMPRQIAMYLIRQETQASLLEIGQLFGGRDHSTVLHACEKIDRAINLNPTLRREMIAIREQLAHQ
jgi:chromosomal replication initiator protein